MTWQAQRREVWDKRRIGICAAPLLFGVLTNGLVRKALSSKGRKDKG